MYVWCVSDLCTCTFLFTSGGLGFETREVGCRHKGHTTGPVWRVSDLEGTF